MIYRVRFAPEAEVDLDDAVRWYERQRVGLGLALVAEVNEVVTGIERWPQLGALVLDVETPLAARRIPVRRFPYYVVWVVIDDLIYIVAVAHNRRRPGYWATRMGEQ